MRKLSLDCHAVGSARYGVGPEVLDYIPYFTIGDTVAGLGIFGCCGRSALFLENRVDAGLRTCAVVG
jgi:hypothetical protein